MSVLPKSLLGSDDDWIETFREKWYPRLHPYLEKVGGYGLGAVSDKQYIGISSEDEDTIERELAEVGFIRNPVACLKSLPDGRTSEGSWVLLNGADTSGEIEQGMQLHLTLFDREDGQAGRELYAHYEDDWRTSPSAHLNENNFSASKGVKIGRQILDDESFLVVE